MPFGQRLDHAAKLVEARLSALLDQIGLGGAPARLVEAMRIGALGGGKRLRPFLVMECAGLFGVAAADALDTACAVECVHCYSLVHDDLPCMDNDDVRRGRPTVHKAFDEWTAILAGDALLTKAFELLANSPGQVEAAVRAELVGGLAMAAGALGLVGGQCFDLEADKLHIPLQPRLSHVERLQAMKTGALIRFSCEAGAILGRAGKVEREALGCYGEHLGLAFQITDDLLDIEGDAATLGKATRKDSGKATLVSLMGLNAAKTRLAALESQAVAALQPFGRDADTLREAAAFVVQRQT